MEPKKAAENLYRYLTKKLIPFWMTRAESPSGGFSTSYDGDGNPVPGADKTLLCQGRCIFALSHLLRWGFFGPEETGAAAAKIEQGIAYLREYFRDSRNGGYIWICSSNGDPVDTNKVVYGHSFLIYGLSEYALASGNKDAAREAEELFSLLEEKAADPEFGGYLEHFDPDWNPRISRSPGEESGSIHKSLDVHMHLMEAFTELGKLTGKQEHLKALRDVYDLIFEKMVAPAGPGSEETAGVSMFRRDWTPIANVELDTVWGSDRFEKGKKSPEITSYGHNVELAWLSLKAAEVLGIPEETAALRALPLFRHTLKRGIDAESGGLYVEGEREGGPTDTDKEFWQQAEALAGFALAYRLTGDPAFYDGFENIRAFVFRHLVHPELGEWFPLTDREGNLKRHYLGHGWKTCYHTLRGISLAVRHLEESPEG
ncbi:MAG: AGE family epimerase/isomerase [Spirochaetia bacterium]